MSPMTYPSHHAHVRVKSVGVKKKSKIASSKTLSRGPDVQQPAHRKSIQQAGLASYIADVKPLEKQSVSTHGAIPAAVSIANSGQQHPHLTATAPTVAGVANPFKMLSQVQASPNGHNSQFRGLAHLEYLRQVKEQVARTVSDPQSQNVALQRARDWLNSAEKLNNLNANKESLDPFTRRRVEAGVRLAEIHDRLQKELESAAPSRLAQGNELGTVKKAMDAAARTLGLGTSGKDIYVPDIPILNIDGETVSHAAVPKGQKGMLVDVCADEKGLDVDHPSRSARDEEAWNMIRQLQEKLRATEEEISRLRASTTVRPAETLPQPLSQTCGAIENQVKQPREDSITLIEKASSDMCVAEKEFHRQISELRNSAITSTRVCRASSDDGTAHHSQPSGEYEAEPVYRVPNSIDVTVGKLDKGSVETVPMSVCNMPVLDWTQIGIEPPNRDIICGEQVKTGRGAVESLYAQFDMSRNTSPLSLPAEVNEHDESHMQVGNEDDSSTAEVHATNEEEQSDSDNEVNMIEEVLIGSDDEGSGDQYAEAVEPEAQKTGPSRTSTSPKTNSTRPNLRQAKTNDGTEVRVVHLRGSQARIQERMKQSPLETLADDVSAAGTERQRNKAKVILAKAIKDTPSQALIKLSVDELKHLALALGTTYERPKTKAVTAILEAAQSV